MGRGKRQVVRRFHSSRSSANSLTSSAVTPARPQISSSWVSHLVLGRPTGRLPSGTASYTIRGSRSGAILSTWPYQRIWDFSTERSSGSTPRAVRMSTFLMRSIRVTPTIRLRNLISAACTRDLVLSARICLTFELQIEWHHRTRDDAFGKKR